MKRRIFIKFLSILPASILLRLRPKTPTRKPYIDMSGDNKHEELLYIGNCYNGYHNSCLFARKIGKWNGEHYPIMVEYMKRVVWQT